MKRIVQGVGLALLILSLVACGPKEEPKTQGEAPITAGEGKVLRTVNASEPGSLDPALAQGTHESWILRHIYEGLMKYEPDGTVSPAMAEKMEVSEDGKTYTFTLRKGLTWSNGDPLTAKDFEFAWKRVANPETKSHYAHHMFYIEGAEEFNQGQGKEEDMKVNATDDVTLVVKLKDPVPYFTQLMAYYTFFPVEKKVVEENPDWAKKPETHVSNGAFTLKEWEHNAKITLAKNPKYYEAQKVKLDAVTLDILNDQNTQYQKYEGGEYDLLVDPIATVVAEKKDKDPELVIGPLIGTYYINTNTNTPPFTNAKVRKALSMAIDRHVICEKIAQGGQVPAAGVVPPGVLDENGKDYRQSTENWIRYDQEEAKKLLEEGLKEENMTLSDLNGKVLLYNTNESHKKIAQALQNMWKEALGVEIGLENVDFQVKLDREKAGDFDLSRAGWIGDYADPMTMLDLWLKESSFNDAQYKSEKYNELLAKVRKTNDQKERFALMREAEKTLMEDMPILPIYFYTQPYLVKKNVKGITKVPTEYPNFKFADIE